MSLRGMGVSVLGIFLHSFNSITRAGEIIWEICGPETKVARILLLVIGFMLHEVVPSCTLAGQTGDE